MREALEQPEYRGTTTDAFAYGWDYRRAGKITAHREFTAVRFNSEKPSLDDNVRFSVLEMGELKDKA